MAENAQELQQAYHQTLQYMQGLKDRMAAEGLLVKDRPYIQLYSDITRELMNAEHRQDLLVLIEIANHADELGWCYPSIQTIGIATHYHPSTVAAAVSRLMARDWLRVSMTYNRRRKRYEKDFVLSPAVISIRPEIRDEAWQQFRAVPHCKSYDELKDSVTENIKPYTEPATATRNTNQNQGPESEPSSSSSPKNGGGKKRVNSATAQPDPESANTDSDSAANSVSNSAAIPTGQQSPPVPRHPPLPLGFDPKEPLPDPQDEAAVKRLHRMFPTLSFRSARMYIARYPRDIVLVTAQMAKDSPHVKNPVGKMDSDLRKGLTDVKDYQRLAYGGYSDDDDDFVEH